MTQREEDSPPPSKTRRKQAMEELQSLGDALAALPADRVKKMPIPEELREAVMTVQRMTRHDEARRRQMQYIGKLMRAVDAAPVRLALAQARGDSAEETARLHQIERLRDTLLADEKVLHEIATRYPGADLQHLRALRRAALREQAENRPPRSFRAIFQVLKTLAADNEAP